MSPILTSVLVKGFLNANNCRSKVSVISLEAASCAIMRSFHYGKNWPDGEAFCASVKSSSLYSHPQRSAGSGPETSARDKSSQVPPYLREDLFAWEPIVFPQAFKNCARKTLRTLKNPGAPANSLN